MAQCRCSKCGARKTLGKLPGMYIRRPPQCPAPGCRSRRWRLDRWRIAHEVGPNAPEPCRCGEYIGRDGNPMPHRRGSGWCIHNDNITTEDRRERWENGYRNRNQLHG